MNIPRRTITQSGRLKLRREFAALAQRLVVDLAGALAIAMEDWRRLAAAPSWTFHGNSRAIAARVEVQTSAATLRRARMIVARR